MEIRSQVPPEGRRYLVSTLEGSLRVVLRRCPSGEVVARWGCANRRMNRERTTLRSGPRSANTCKPAPVCTSLAPTETPRALLPREEYLGEYHEGHFEEYLEQRLQKDLEEHPEQRLEKNLEKRFQQYLDKYLQEYIC
ncbi:hypothetical protein KM043_004059 [Ampulex compressa]|nr:hypothetical protein KM043_004059 [Ampulex compressa]